MATIEKAWLGVPTTPQQEPAVSELAVEPVRVSTLPQWGLQDTLALRSLMVGARLAEQHGARQVLRGDEVTLERVSLALAKGPVAIAVSDEQAKRIMERHRRDAFPPQ